MDIAINYLAVIVAAVAAFLFGWAWHSPLLFMKPWMRMMRYQKMEDAMGAVGPGLGMPLAGLMTLVQSFILAYLIVLVNATSWQTSLHLALLAWLAFMVPVMLNQVLWEKKSWALFGFNAAYQLCSLALMGVILGLWH